MKIPVFLLCLLLIISLIGCSNKQEDFSSLIAVCSGKAQEYIDAGDYASAINVLEEGITATNSEELSDILETVYSLMDESNVDLALLTCPTCSAENNPDAKFCSSCGVSIATAPFQDETPEDQSRIFDLSPYIGIWAEEATGWQFGGMILELSIDNDLLVIELSETQSAPYSRVAEASTSIPLQDIQGNTFTWEIENDGWGHSCNTKIELCTDITGTDYIMVTTTDIQGASSMWGLSEGCSFLYKNDLAYEALFYTPEMYAEMSGNNARPDPQFSDEASIYTADGLLTVSETNITMQNDAILYVSLSYAGSVSWYCDSSIISMRWGEFDANGTAPLYITGNQTGSTIIRISDTNYPNEYIEVNVTVSGLAAIDNSNASGILASLGMTEAEFRESCQRLLSNNVQLAQITGTELYYSDIVKYPNNYIDKHFVIDNVSEYSYDFLCSYKGTSDDGYLYYEDYDYYDYNAVIYDFRDDPYSPNIVQDDDFTPYVIFKGVRTISGEEWLVFWMISVDMR